MPAAPQGGAGVRQPFTRKFRKAQAQEKNPVKTQGNPAFVRQPGTHNKRQLHNPVKTALWTHRVQRSYSRSGKPVVYPVHDEISFIGKRVVGGIIPDMFVIFHIAVHLPDDQFVVSFEPSPGHDKARGGLPDP